MHEGENPANLVSYDGEKPVVGTPISYRRRVLEALLGRPKDDTPRNPDDGRVVGRIGFGAVPTPLLANSYGGQARQERALVRIPVQGVVDEC
jgi:hypothetical protein